MSRVLLITPARNEAAHLERTARSVEAQTRPPDLWLVVDDGSTDSTPGLLGELEERIPFLRRLSAPPGNQNGRDRLALAAEARAFNWALGTVEAEDFTHIGKLDADIELPPDYFEKLLVLFAASPRLGIAGGGLLERDGDAWRPSRVPEYHVRGALKLYSRECLEQIGGVEERLGWDTIDETYARMHGYETRSLPEVTAKHLRPVATADGALRGRARHGQCAYIVRYPPGWMLLRSAKVACSRPRGVSGLAFLFGYLRSWLRREERVEDERFRRFVAYELRSRIRLAPARILNRPAALPAEAQVPPIFMRSFDSEGATPPRDRKSVTPEWTR